MSEKITLAFVLRLLDARRPVTPGHYYLCAIDKQLALRIRKDVPDHPDIITTLNSRQVTGDISSWKWRQIENRISFLMKKGKLCSPPHKH